MAPPHSADLRRFGQRCVYGEFVRVELVCMRQRKMKPIAFMLAPFAWHDLLQHMYLYSLKSQSTNEPVFCLLARRNDKGLYVSIPITVWARSEKREGLICINSNYSLGSLGETSRACMYQFQLQFGLSRSNLV